MARQRKGISTKIKDELLVKAMHRCCLCPQHEDITEIHHIIPIREKGPNTEENLMVVCPTCHSKIHRIRKMYTPDQLKMYKEKWERLCAQKLPLEELIIKAPCIIIGDIKDSQVTIGDENIAIQKDKGVHSQFDVSQMCIGIVAIILLGIERFRRINKVLSTERKIAELIGLPEFFDQCTVHRFLNEFQKWHLKQLEEASHRLIHTFGESPRQDVLVVDIDSTTHSLESRKRERAIVGYNKKNRGKPCYQWSVAFVRGEVVAQRLNPGDTHGTYCL